MPKYSGGAGAAPPPFILDPNSLPTCFLIYLPERVFDFEAFLSDVKAVMDKHGRCVVAISEGVGDKDHTPIAAKLATHVEKDPHGNVELGGGALADLLTKLIKDKLGLKRVRGDTFGYVQRSFLGCVSDVDQREAREVGDAWAPYRSVAVWYIWRSLDPLPVDY